MGTHKARGVLKFIGAMISGLVTMTAAAYWASRTAKKKG